MASFVSWLKEQEGREQDPVGWFAVFWREREHPRLSSPASIAKWLEDQRLFETTPGLTEAYDATLAEYRKVRAEVVRDTASQAGVQLPLPEHQPGAEEPERGLAGQAVDRATQAAQEAAQAHGIGAGAIIATSGNLMNTQRAQMGTGAMLELILRKLEGIERVMGLATDEDDTQLPADLPWSDWYDQAAVYATARGEGWDQQEGA